MVKSITDLVGHSKYCTKQDSSKCKLPSRQQYGSKNMLARRQQLKIHAWQQAAEPVSKPNKRRKTLAVGHHLDTLLLVPILGFICFIGMTTTVINIIINK